MKSEEQNILIDGSKLITESLVRSGADIFVGYPITPSNRFYAYGQQRFPTFYPAPDEISVLQWMSGASAAGKLPVTATAFPGLALMVESINMAFVMELPMVLVVTQRLGPSTGSATTGAQGDLGLINNLVPGFPIPTFCPTSFEDCWNLAHKAVHTAVELRTPVILLTSKEMVMTSRSFDLTKLKKNEPVKRPLVDLGENYLPYRAEKGQVAPFLEVGNSHHQVRLNASMHNFSGKIVKNIESLSVSKNLAHKVSSQASALAEIDYRNIQGAKKIIISWGISALAAIDAHNQLLKDDKLVSLLLIKSLIPIPEIVFEIIGSYKEVLFVEENINGQLREMILGKRQIKGLKSINKFGSMIAPSEIVTELV